MSESTIINVFKNVSTPSLSETQRQDIASLLAEYLNSYDFELHVKEILSRYAE